MKRMSPLLAPVTLALLLSACTEPQTATPAEQAPAAAQPETAESSPALPKVSLLDAAAKDQPLIVAGECNIESVAGQAFTGTSLPVGDKAKLKVTGWLKPGADGAAIAEPALRIESADKSQIWQHPIQLSVVRDDVAANGVASGFELVVDASDIPAGNYHLYLAFKSAQGLGSCDNGRYVDLK